MNDPETVSSLRAGPGSLELDPSALLWGRVYGSHGPESNWVSRGQGVGRAGAGAGLAG